MSADQTLTPRHAQAVVPIESGFHEHLTLPAIERITGHHELVLSLRQPSPTEPAAVEHTSYCMAGS